MFIVLIHLYILTM